MSEEKKYYCFCSSNCKYETMSKEQILSAIEQAARGEPVIDPDAGVLTKVKETNSGDYITFWVGTQAQYNALNGNTVRNCLYIITDETTGEDINKAIKEIKQDMYSMQTNIFAKKTVERYVAGKNIAIRSSNTGVTTEYCNIRTYYNKPLGMARITMRIDIKGKINEGDEISIVLPSGIHKAAAVNSEPRAFPMSCYSVKERALQAIHSTTSITLRVMGGEDISESDISIFYVDGWYPCDGEVT